MCEAARRARGRLLLLTAARSSQRPAPPDCGSAGRMPAPGGSGDARGRLFSCPPPASNVLEATAAAAGSGVCVCVWVCVPTAAPLGEALAGDQGRGRVGRESDPPPPWPAGCEQAVHMLLDPRSCAGGRHVRRGRRSSGRISCELYIESAARPAPSPCNRSPPPPTHPNPPNPAHHQPDHFLLPLLPRPPAVLPRRHARHARHAHAAEAPGPQ